MKILEVHVDKGMKHGQKITFGGEADQAPGVEPGDIVLVLQEKDHEVGQPFSTDSFLQLHCAYWSQWQQVAPLSLFIFTKVEQRRLQELQVYPSGRSWESGFSSLLRLLSKISAFL